jgi:hypothetical protein
VEEHDKDWVRRDESLARATCHDALVRGLEEEAQQDQKVRDR